MIVDCLRLVEVAVEERMLVVVVVVLLEVIEVRVSSVEIAISRARWWDFSSGLLMLAMSVTFANAFGTRLYGVRVNSDTEVNIEWVNPR